MRYTSGVILLFLSLLATSQSSWNWPSDPDLEKQAKEKQAYYKILIQTDQYQEAFNTLFWLYQNTPDLHESIYKDGAKIIDELLETDLPADKKTRLEDSLLWTFDQRIELFDKDGSALDRKAYTAFKMYYKSPEKYPLLDSLYGQLYAYDASVISDFNITPYMTLTTYYYRTDPKAMDATRVLDIHTRITSVIDEKIAAGGSKTKLQKEQDKIDAFLNSLGNIISCDFIAEKLVPKMEADTNDLNLSKKVFSYSLKAKCTDQPYFLTSGEQYFSSEPSFSVANVLAERYYFSGNYEKAMKYYTEMKELSTDQDQEFEALMGLASTHVKLNNKPKGRALAYEALSVRPGAAEPYNLIGNLYFLSYEQCRAGESIVKDRAVFIAAYDMYQKAGNISQMAAAKEQFPSIEEIFNENREEGEKITVDCWINETVNIERR